MDGKFSVALDIINNVKALEGCFQININQCHRLVGFYKKVGQFFEHLQKVNRDYNGELMSLPSLDVTISVLRKGHLLLAKYTEVDWFESLVTAGVNQDSFEAIHVELEACMVLIHDRVESGFAGTMLVPRPLMQLATVAPLLYLSERDRASLFGGDAEEDKKHMLAKIRVKRTTVFGSRDLTDEQRTDEIRSLEMATEKLREIEDQQPPATKELPSYLRINSSEIDLLRPIGSGGSGEVHKCRWLHHEYAVKILNRGDVVGLQKEIENLIRLRHPNIVLLVGFAVDQYSSRPMIVMELLDHDLRTLLDFDVSHPFPMSIAVDLIYQIATGMAYLHRRMIFHGDLKAVNVLIRRYANRYEVKISDFGVSQHVINSDTDSNVLDFIDNTSFNTANVGTTRWRAPEVFDVTGGDKSFYSLKADVYSFAMTCFEILTKEIPFMDISAPNIKRHIQAGNRPKLPPSVPEDLRNLLAKCWHQESILRPDFSQICTEMQRMKYHPSFSKMRGLKGRMKGLKGRMKGLKQYHFSPKECCAWIL